MTAIIVTVCILTGLIHCAETLSYSLRLAGVRTGKLAVSLSLTGILLLVSRTANMVQSPLAGGLIDLARAEPGVPLKEGYHWIIMASSVGTAVAIILFPSFVLLFSRMISHLETAGSLPRMVTSVTVEQLRNARYHLRRPRWSMLRSLRYHGVPYSLFIMNACVTGIYTVGVLAALYASFLFPDMAAFTSQSSGLINGVATILLTVFIDPHLAMLTDKAQRDPKAQAGLGQVLGAFMLSRLAGTLLAQLLFLPAAYWIGWVSGLLH
ncbi:lipid II flippase Amj family protein [Paenibacillus mesotrionivorans]|jgi:hypothetical protein|uniref:Lipid II flippase Amj family protein n=1 Tax=Paenibacillus mesotrionivorans TaxID=3160968 RepID=A0ACC7P2Q2_9BACL